MRVTLPFLVARIALADPAAAVTAEPPAAGESAPVTVEGLYPLWEHTGELFAPGAFQVGYGHAALGVPRAQIGTQPFLDLYGTANAQAKVALWRAPRVRLALETGWYRVPTEAQSREIGNLHTVTLVNPYGPVTLLPVSLAASVTLSPRALLHLSTMALGELAADSRDQQVTGGAAAMLELRATGRWAVLVHAGVEGMPATVQEHVGLSFVYRLPHLDLRAGYARRFEDGESSGFPMFDAAVVF